MQLNYNLSSKPKLKPNFRFKHGLNQI